MGVGASPPRPSPLERLPYGSVKPHRAWQPVFHLHFLSPSLSCVGQVGEHAHSTQSCKVFFQDLHRGFSLVLGEELLSQPRQERPAPPAGENQVAVILMFPFIDHSTMCPALSRLIQYMAARANFEKASCLGMEGKGNCNPTHSFR